MSADVVKSQKLFNKYITELEYEQIKTKNITNDKQITTKKIKL